jgi:hypothetical protein
MDTNDEIESWARAKVRGMLARLIELTLAGVKL